MPGDVQVPVEGVSRFASQILDALKSGGRPTAAIRKAFKQIGAIYRSFAKERFSAQSRGGGDWPPLAESTIRRRRSGKERTLRTAGGGATRTDSIAGGSVGILWDTGTLVGGLEPTLSPDKGALERDIPFGVRVGFGGPARHPKGMTASIADIAHFHQSGSATLPAREIIVPPPDRVQQRFVAVLEKALLDAWREEVR